MKKIKTDHFLSEEDISLRDMDWDELIAWWNLWLEQAQASNDIDQHEYSHGVFRHEPAYAVKKTSATNRLLIRKSLATKNHKKHKQLSCL